MDFKKRLTESYFVNILNKDVRYVYNENDDLHEIYIETNQYMDLSDTALLEYGSDYYIGQSSKTNKWFYGIGYESHATFDEPAYFDWTESKDSYESFGEALSALIIALVSDEMVGINYELTYLTIKEDDL